MNSSMLKKEEAEQPPPVLRPCTADTKDGEDGAVLKQAADARHEAESALGVALEAYHASTQSSAAVTGAPAVDSDAFLEACTSNTSALTATCLQAADEVGHWLLKARVANLESHLVEEAASLMRRLHQEETAAMAKARMQAAAEAEAAAAEAEAAELERLEAVKRRVEEAQELAREEEEARQAKLDEQRQRREERLKEERRLQREAAAQEAAAQAELSAAWAARAAAKAGGTSATSGGSMAQIRQRHAARLSAAGSPNSTGSSLMGLARCGPRAPAVLQALSSTDAASADALVAAVAEATGVERAPPVKRKDVIQRL